MDDQKVGIKIVLPRELYLIWSSQESILKKELEVFVSKNKSIIFNRFINIIINAICNPEITHREWLRKAIETELSYKDIIKKKEYLSISKRAFVNDNKFKEAKKIINQRNRGGISLLITKSMYFFIIEMNKKYTDAGKYILKD